MSVLSIKISVPVLARYIEYAHLGRGGEPSQVETANHVPVAPFATSFSFLFPLSVAHMEEKKILFPSSKGGRENRQGRREEGRERRGVEHSSSSPFLEGSQHGRREEGER